MRQNGISSKRTAECTVLCESALPKRTHLPLCSKTGICAAKTDCGSETEQVSQWDGTTSARLKKGDLADALGRYWRSEASEVQKMETGPTKEAPTVLAVWKTATTKKWGCCGIPCPAGVRPVEQEEGLSLDVHLPGSRQVEIRSGGDGERVYCIEAGVRGDFWNQSLRCKEIVQETADHQRA